MLRFHIVTKLCKYIDTMAEEALDKFLLSYLVLLLSQTSIIAVDYELEGILIEEMDNMDMDGKN